jgi:hypothetical protein
MFYRVKREHAERLKQIARDERITPARVIHQAIEARIVAYRELQALLSAPLDGQHYQIGPLDPTTRRYRCACGGYWQVGKGNTVHVDG